LRDELQRLGPPPVVTSGATGTPSTGEGPQPSQLSKEEVEPKEDKEENKKEGRLNLTPKGAPPAPPSSSSRPRSSSHPRRKKSLRRKQGNPELKRRSQGQPAAEGIVEENPKRGEGEKTGFPGEKEAGVAGGEAGAIEERGGAVTEIERGEKNWILRKKGQKEEKRKRGGQRNRLNHLARP
jgi:hypothetical protein